MTRDELRAYGAALAQKTPPLPPWVLEEAAAVYVAALAEHPDQDARSAG